MFLISEPIFRFWRFLCGEYEFGDFFYNIYVKMFALKYLGKIGKFSVELPSHEPPPPKDVKVVCESFL